MAKIGSTGMVRRNTSAVVVDKTGRIERLERALNTGGSPAPRPRAGAVKAWLAVSDGAVTPPSGAFAVVEFAADDSQPKVGSGIGWTVGVPDTVFINRTMCATVSFFGTGSAGVDCVVDMQIDLTRGGDDHIGVFDGIRPFKDLMAANDVDGVFLQGCFPSVPMQAGDTLKLEARSSDLGFATAFSNVVMIVAET